jgi:serine/threonine protein phosphatase PrpC
MENSSRILILSLFIFTISSNLVFKIRGIYDGAFVELPKEDKPIGVAVGEDAYITTPISIFLADGVGSCEFSSSFLARYLTLSGTKGILNDALKVTNYNRKTLLNQFTSQVTEDIRKYNEAMISNFMNSEPESTKENFDFINPGKLETSTTMVSVRLSHDKSRNKTFLNLIQKGDSLAVIFRPQKFVSKETNIESYLYTPVFMTNQQQFCFNFPNQFTSESKLYTASKDDLLSFEVKKRDIVILGSDGLFDNISIKFFTFIINLQILDQLSKGKFKSSPEELLLLASTTYRRILADKEEEIQNYIKGEYLKRIQKFEDEDFEDFERDTLSGRLIDPNDFNAPSNTKIRKTISRNSDNSVSSTKTHKTSLLNSQNLRADQKLGDLSISGKLVYKNGRRSKLEKEEISSKLPKIKQEAFQSTIANKNNRKIQEESSKPEFKIRYTSNRKSSFDSSRKSDLQSMKSQMTSEKNIRPQGDESNEDDYDNEFLDNHDFEFSPKKSLELPKISNSHDLTIIRKPKNKNRNINLPQLSSRDPVIDVKEDSNPVFRVPFQRRRLVQINTPTAGNSNNSPGKRKYTPYSQNINIKNENILKSKNNRQATEMNEEDDDYISLQISEEEKEKKLEKSKDFGEASLNHHPSGMIRTFEEIKIKDSNYFSLNRRLLADEPNDDYDDKFKHDSAILKSMNFFKTDPLSLIHEVYDTLTENIIDKDFFEILKKDFSFSIGELDTFTSKFDAQSNSFNIANMVNNLVNDPSYYPSPFYVQAKKAKGPEFKINPEAKDDDITVAIGLVVEGMMNEGAIKEYIDLLEEEEKDWKTDAKRAVSFFKNDLGKKFKKKDCPEESLMPEQILI